MTSLLTAVQSSTDLEDSDDPSCPRRRIEALVGVYLRGNAVTLVERFTKIDPSTLEVVLADPTTITFSVRDPDGVETQYVFGTDSNVTRQETGIYLCALQPPLPPGPYWYGCVGTGAVEAASQGSFTILESGQEPPIFPTVAQYGPCNIWIDGAYVSEWDETIAVGSSVYLLDPYAEMASQLMYQLTGRQFAGTCQRKVRPCRQSCVCFGMNSSLGGSGPLIWPSTVSAWWWGGWSWYNECGDACGCGNESYIDLAGYPVQRILEVKVDGNVLTEGVDYRLDARKRLIRLADLSADPILDRFWPACQDLSRPDTEPGTYSVTYEWGQPVQEFGKQAAAQLAAELWRASPSNQGECRLPSKVTRIVRQGIEMDRVVPMAELLRSGATGLALVDAYIAMTNPTGARMRSAVFSPDLQPYARQLGQDEFGT